MLRYTVPADADMPPPPPPTRASGRFFLSPDRFGPGQRAFRYLCSDLRYKFHFDRVGYEWYRRSFDAIRTGRRPEWLRRCLEDIEAVEVTVGDQEVTPYLASFARQHLPPGEETLEPAGRDDSFRREQHLALDRELFLYIEEWDVKDIAITNGDLDPDTLPNMSADELQEFFLEHYEQEYLLEQHNSSQFLRCLQEGADPDARDEHTGERILFVLPEQDGLRAQTLLDWGATPL